MAEELTAGLPIAARVAWVRDDRAHGASALAREAAAIVRASARQGLEPGADAWSALQQVRQTALALAGSRPSMVAVANTVGRIWAEAYATVDIGSLIPTSAVVPQALEAVQAGADKTLAGWTTASEQIANHARPFLKGTLLTHSLSGTVQTTLLACKGQIKRVYVTEGRPRCEGRATALALAAAGIAVTLLTDAEAGLFIPECAAVVVGADSILADGAVVNKTGTYLLALAARANRPRRVPFLALAETLKISPLKKPLLEEMAPAEVVSPSDVPGVSARNIYFDRTPAALVSALITERGLLDRAQVRDQAAEARRWGQALWRAIR
jgi:translation initiation factor 2B subunit (eIF-2B alpha/beta/delta family)